VRRLIVLGLRSRRIADKIAYAKLVAKSMRNNEYFPDPIPALDELDSGLAAATRYSFRFRARGAGGLGEWSRVISLVVDRSRDGTTEPAKPRLNPEKSAMPPWLSGEALCERSM
jgi:hypothetical protein